MERERRRSEHVGTCRGAGRHGLRGLGAEEPPRVRAGRQREMDVLPLVRAARGLQHLGDPRDRNRWHRLRRHERRTFRGPELGRTAPLGDEPRHGQDRLVRGGGRQRHDLRRQRQQGCRPPRLRRRDAVLDVDGRRGALVPGHQRVRNRLRRRRRLEGLFDRRALHGLRPRGEQRAGRRLQQRPPASRHDHPGLPADPPPSARTTSRSR